MKTMLIAIVGFLPLIAGAQDMTNTINGTPIGNNKTIGSPLYYPSQVQVPNALDTVTQPTGWTILARYNGPNIPPGWQIANMESVIQNGTSIRTVLYYLYNPTTHQTLIWAVSVS